MSSMGIDESGGTDAGGEVVGREVFKDGSELVYLKNGVVLLRESKFSKALVGAEVGRIAEPSEGSVRYDWAPPPPKTS